MKTKKKFDCLQMKETIQAQLHKKWHGLSAARIRQDIIDSIAASDDSLVVRWRSISGSSELNFVRRKKA